MNKKEMIDKIYEVVGDKTLSFGCLCKTKYGDVHPLLYREYNLKKNKDESFLFSKMRGKYAVYTDNCIIKGHPVMINTILHWVDKNKSGPDREEYIIPICDLYVDKDKPIEEQHEKCITYIYDLITK